MTGESRQRVFSHTSHRISRQPTDKPGDRVIKQTICLAGQAAIDNWNRKKYDETRGAAAAGKFCLERGNQGKGLFPHQTQRVTRRMRSTRTCVNPGQIRKGAGPRKPREIETERAGKGGNHSALVSTLHTPFHSPHYSPRFVRAANISRTHLGFIYDLIPN